METLKHVSVIVPVYNEEENVPLLHQRISDVLLAQTTYSYEIIYVDDGSTDSTYSRLHSLAENDRNVTVVRLRRNFGQTAGIAAGVAHSRGDILVFMDGDLQNDPVDIPRLLAKLEEGYDVVSGWRKDRKDAMLSRKFPSLVANRLISKVTGVYLHDYGCSLKAYRRAVFRHVRLYGEMHRFMPAYTTLAGAAIAEIEVTHHPRQFGRSKYGISRTFRVILDLMTFKFLGSYGTRPFHAFGVPGLFSLGIGTLTALGWLVRRILPPHVRVHRNPLLQISLLFYGFGLQCFMVGLLAEMLMRTYHEAQGKSIYVVRDVISSHSSDEDEKTEARIRAIS
jgi:glycosyltransferase involved in cell wall biosynthesis